MSYLVVVEGLDRVASAEDLDSRITQAAMRAINKTAPHARAVAVRHMDEQIDFPSGYLNDERIGVRSLATQQSLEAHIGARMRPTSLARFVENPKDIGKYGLTVTVEPGHAKYMSRAFLMKLRAGAGIETKYNLGLAIRTKKAPPDKAYKPVKINDSLWLIYGPSVDQVFKGVANDISPEVSAYLETEFERQFTLLGGGDG